MPDEVPVAILGRVPLFKDLAADELARLAALMTVQTVAATTAVFWIGDAGADFHVVLEGSVVLTYPDEEGRESLLARLGPGQFFGELSLLDGGARTATARAETAVRLACLSRAKFLEFIGSHPWAAVQAMGVMGARQREMLTKLRAVKNTNEVLAATEGWWHRTADVIARVSASMPFVMGHIAWFGTWILVNLLLGETRALDPYPFGLLTMVVSLEAIFLSIFVLISQNRAGVVDRLRADLDYQVNLKAHLEVMHLHEKIDRLDAMLTHHTTETVPPEPDGATAAKGV